MGTKREPGDFDCYSSADEDEPMFVLLARDELAPSVVEDWAVRRLHERGPSAKVDEAFQCARDMRTWKLQRGEG